MHDARPTPCPCTQKVRTGVATTSHDGVYDGVAMVVVSRFSSSAIDGLINAWKPRFKWQNMSVLFSNCLPNTLDTTVFSTNGSYDTFIITGDIPAMWLRDSANQVAPYIPYVNQDPALKSLIQGLIGRHARSVNLDAVRWGLLCARELATHFVGDPISLLLLQYANAFQFDGEHGAGPHMVGTRAGVDGVSIWVRGCGHQ